MKNPRHVASTVGLILILGPVTSLHSFGQAVLVPADPLMARDCDVLKKRYADYIKDLQKRSYACTHEWVFEHGDKAFLQQCPGGRTCIPCQPLDAALTQAYEKQTKQLAACRAAARQERQEAERREAEEKEREQAQRQAASRQRQQQEQAAARERQQSQEQQRRQREEATWQQDARSRESIAHQHPVEPAAVVPSNVNRRNVAPSGGPALSTIPGQGPDRRYLGEDANAALSQAGEELRRQQRLLQAEAERQERDAAQQRESREQQQPEISAPPSSTPSSDTESGSRDASDEMTLETVVRETGRSLVGEMISQMRNGEAIDVKMAAQDAIENKIKEMKDLSVRYLISKLPADPRWDAETLYFTFLSDETSMLTPLQAVDHVKAYYEKVFGNRFDEALQ